MVRDCAAVDLNVLLQQRTLQVALHDLQPALPQLQASVRRNVHKLQQKNAVLDKTKLYREVRLVITVTC